MKDESPIKLVVTDKKTKEETETLLFFSHEQFYVERLVSIINELRKRDDIDAEKLHSLAIFLRAAERLPMVTDSVSITISLINKAANGEGYFSVFLCADMFELAVGEYIDCGVGWDHQVLDNLKIGLDWRGHDGIETCWEDWLDEFARRARDDKIVVSIEDNDSDIDWHAGPSGAEFWDLLPENDFL